MTVHEMAHDGTGGAELTKLLAELISRVRCSWAVWFELFAADLRQPGACIVITAPSRITCGHESLAGTSSEMKPRPDICLDLIGRSVGYVPGLGAINKQPKVPT